MQSSIREILARNIPKAKLEFTPRGFDIIGDIAVVEIKREVEKYQKEIAKAIIQLHKNIRVVAKKTSAVKEKFRVRKVRVIAGERRTETTYREHGCAIKVDINKAYFSPRLSSERKRIAELAKPNENVMVFFAGVGPFAIAIAKKQKSANVVGVEWNPVAIKYFKENIALNKIQNTVAVKGDVRRQAEKFRDWADRIAMPSPSNSEKFLNAAFVAAKNNCKVHFYKFSGKENPFEEPVLLIEKAARKNRRRVKILDRRIVHPYAPQIVQVCVDFEIKYTFQ